MADPYVRQARGVFYGTVGATDLKAGDPVYFDGTDWERADADDNTKYAEAFATAPYSSGDAKAAFCRSCIIVDTDAPYTQGSTYYLTAPGGTPAAAALTATRPTGANNLVQVLGFGLSTSELDVAIQPVRELQINLQLANPDESAAGQQNGDWTGYVLAAANEAVGSNFMVPQNCVGHVISYLWWTNDADSPALDASDTYTIDVSAGVDDETTTATTDGIAAAALTIADNDLGRADVSGAFDATGIIEPGNVVGVDIDKAAEGAGDDDPLMLCLAVVLLVV